MLVFEVEDREMIGGSAYGGQRAVCRTGGPSKLGVCDEGQVIHRSSTLGVVLFFQCVRFWKEVFPLQNCITLVITLGIGTTLEGLTSKVVMLGGTSLGASQVLESVEHVSTISDLSGHKILVHASLMSWRRM
ncbi:hypothetical protein KIW84_041957 [Lathyrus oleraceus]|uniref:Uncharacterized protein n=1 Tax=Pisum sativum TaxID=3888 RepID=A0A9D5AM45_PEA|nr:hypothetical protein KIW84_041957 [Pisum sativum]